MQSGHDALMVKKKSTRGFASQSEDRLREISAEGGHARAEKMTEKQRTASARKANAARNRKMTKAQRKKIASDAAKERWRLWREAQGD